MALKVDQDSCTGCEACVGLCPDVFEMNDDDLAQVKADADYSGCDEEEAIDICPVEAISKA